MCVRALDPVIDLLDRATELNPDFAWTVYQLTELHKLRSEWPEALFVGNDLARLIPFCYEAYEFRRTAWALLGQVNSRRFGCRPFPPFTLITTRSGVRMGTPVRLDS